jgi:hypothetical protein
MPNRAVPRPLPPERVMNHSAKKQLHEKARKKHRQEMQEYAREAARRGRSSVPFWIMVTGIVAILAGLVAITMW